MTNALCNTLLRLNRASAPRIYSIRQEGDRYILTMPLGGTYPPATAQELVERMSRMAQAAEGRTS